MGWLMWRLWRSPMALSPSTIRALRIYHLTVLNGFTDMRDDMIRLGMATEQQMDDMEASASCLAAREVDAMLEEC